MSVPSDFPRSQAANWSPPTSITPELVALRDIKVRESIIHYYHANKNKAERRRHPPSRTTYNGNKSQKQLLVVDLHDFEIYHSPHYKHRAYELASLHFLDLPLAKRLCFDGFVRLGNVQYYVQGVPLQDSSIEGYGNEDPNVTAYVQSELAAKDKNYEIWYRLKQPTPQYQTFQDTFLWVAQLGKHVIDYMEGSSRSLNCFRANFHLFLTKRFSKNCDFEKWHAVFRYQVDFRVPIVAYIEYLFNQAYNLPNSERLIKQPLWTECMAKAVTPREIRNSIPELTIATPAVYACFKNMYFGKQIQAQNPAKEVWARRSSRKQKLGFASTPLTSLPYTELSKSCLPYVSSPVLVGDVVALTPDEADIKLWKETNRDWLAYVQRTETLHNGTQRLFVLWLYWPHDTNMRKAYYPFENELFLSDHCNCTERELLSTEVKGKYNVDWCPLVTNPKRFFIRQKYKIQKSAFVSMNDEYKTCSCRRRNCKPTGIDAYGSGDTVYLKPTHECDLLEPVMIQNVDKKKGIVLVRKLLRLERDCAKLAKQAHRSSIAPNELVLTNQYEEADVSRIQRRCCLRFISRSEVTTNKIPFPYNHGGAGDLWFISMGLTLRDGVEQLVFLQQLPKNVNQRLKISSDRKLKGMSVFGGGGSLDRGLEEGGAVEFHTVIDYSLHAIRTQQANIKHPNKVCLYCGSVNAFLNSALKGDTDFVVRVGEVEFVAAGCPCVGTDP
jgi:DNA (cytosine-5)-methyltransferase 1